ENIVCGLESHLGIGIGRWSDAARDDNGVQSSGLVNQVQPGVRRLGDGADIFNGNLAGLPATKELLELGLDLGESRVAHDNKRGIARLEPSRVELDHIFPGEALDAILD